MNQSTFPNDTESSLMSPPLSPFFDYAIYILAFVCIFLNVSLPLHICRNKRGRRVRRRNALLANLSVCCTLGAIAGAVHFESDTPLFSGSFQCSGGTFIRNFCACLVPMTVLSMSYERMRQLRLRRRRLSLPLLLSLTWLAAFVGSLPTAFTRTYHTTTANCHKIPLLGSNSLTIVYDVGRFLVYHLAVCLYLLFEMFIVWSKTKYLELFKRKKTWSLYQKAQKIRFVYTISVIFVVIWLPFGIWMTYHKITRHLTNSPSRSQNSYITAIISYIFSICLPIAVFFTNEGLQTKDRLRALRRETKKAKSIPSDFSNFSTVCKSQIPPVVEAQHEKSADESCAPKLVIAKHNTLPELRKPEFKCKMPFEPKNIISNKVKVDVNVQKEAFL